MRTPQLQTEFVTSLSAYEASHVDELDNRWYWTGWQRHQWPATIEWQGKLVYGFDRRAGSRKLCALLRVTRYAVFDYHTWEEFRRGVRRACGWSPSSGDPHAARMPFRKGGKPLIGFAVRWNLVGPVDIPLGVERFPQLGWLRVTGATPIASPSLDAADLYAEGGRLMRTHLVVERNYALRQASRFYWRGRMGGRLRCSVCELDFGERYGRELGEDFVEMHHERWLSLDVDERLAKASDLVPVCSNCHRMIHRYPHLGMTAKKLRRRLAGLSRA